jgi:DNA-binding beta-propeller fold protein YncE
MNKRPIILTSLLGILVIFLSLSCCKDCPDCPVLPEPPPVGHYRIYTFDSYHRFIVSIDTPADTIVDSIRVDFNGYGIFATPDGNHVLVTNTSNFTMEIYNASDLTHIGSSDQYGDYYFDGSEGYGLCVCFNTDNIYFIDPVSLNPYDSVSRCVGYGYLDTVNNLFFGSNFELDSLGHLVNANIILVIDCDTRTLVDSIIVWPDPSSVSVLELAYDWLTEDLYFHAWFDGHSRFVQYDTKTDSIVNLTSTTYAIGSVAVSPDGKLIFMTDGGDGSHWVQPPGYIYVFDATTHEVADLIPPYLFPDGPIEEPFFGQIILTPDNRRAYVSSNRNAWHTVPIIVVDLIERKPIRAILPLEAFWAESITIAPIPKE